MSHALINVKKTDSMCGRNKNVFQYVDGPRHKNYTLQWLVMTNLHFEERLFRNEKFNRVINLTAQVSVRLSV